MTTGHLHGGWTYVAAAAIACLPSIGTSHAASTPPAKNPAVTLEPMPGGQAKRVILTPKAAERLGINTASVQEQAIGRRQMVGGLAIRAPDTPPEVKPGSGFGGFVQSGPETPNGVNTSIVAQRASTSAAGDFARVTPAVQSKSASSGIAGFTAPTEPPKLQPATERAERAAAAIRTEASGAASAAIPGSVLIAVTLTPGEWERLAKDKPARILPLATRAALAREVIALPSGMAPREDARRSMLTVYYTVSGNDHGLTMNQRMRVDLQLSGSEDKQKVVPYSAIYYDAKGSAWVYVNPKPYVFERQLVSVERVVGDVAVLADGPAVGTAVVTTGAALLYGAEIFGK